MLRVYEFEYVEARRVLLDALEALGAQRRAVVLVGAQAIFHRVGEGTLQVAPFTSDGDLALHPALLEDEPLLAEAFINAGFALVVRPGTWARNEVQIDLMVPATLGGSGRRGARLGLHGMEAARKAAGLEAALVDFDLFMLDALDPADGRSVEVAVAGLGALLVAKLHKLAEREATPARWVPKDGLDVLRILQAADFDALGERLAALERDPIAGLVTQEARGHFQRLFVDRSGHGTAMAVQATVGLEDPATIAGSCAALASALAEAWRAAPNR